MQNDSQTPPRPAEGYEGAPRIKLGGQEWPMPLLAPRQNRIIEPRILPLLQIIIPKYEKVKDLLGRGERPPADFNLLTEEQYDLAVELVAMALTRAHPTFKRDHLLDMAGVNAVTLITALTVVMQQTGLFLPAGSPGAAGAPKAGEIASPSTGTA